MSNKPPIEVPQGAIRLNTDSQKLEFFAQDRWYEMATDVPTLDGGARGLTSGFYNPGISGATNEIDYITIETQGNAIDFGDLTTTAHDGGALASRTRYCHTGGSRNGSNSVTIDFVTIASTGDAQDFGDLQANLYQGTACGNQTRGIVYVDAGAPSGDHFCDFITIASTGNAIRFGEIFGQNGARQNCGSVASPTRMIIGGGGFPNVLSGMDYCTITTQGDFQDFGDLVVASRSQSGAHNSTRGIFTGGGPPSAVNVMEYVQIATLGNATNYGDLAASDGGGRMASMSSRTRGVLSTGSNVLSMCSLVTSGNTVDFGDAVNVRSSQRGSSNAHGGL